MTNLGKVLMNDQVEREYKIALEHIEIAKANSRDRVYIDLIAEVANRVRSRLVVDGYSVEMTQDSVTKVTWPTPRPIMSRADLCKQAAEKLSPEERDALGLNEDGTYCFAIAKHKVTIIHRDSWSGPEDGESYFFDTESQTRQFIKDFNEKSCPPRPDGRVPECYSVAEYKGVTTLPGANKKD